MRQMFNILTSADTAHISTGMYNGREHRIVPLVALVEGVLHSANSASPELALASEFGRHPQGWDGRPVVMNHPEVDGQYVGANSPSVLEAWSYGLLFNTSIDEGKLKTEAWLDVERINSAGGEVADTLARIESGALVEVSTGLFASVDEQSGRFNGATYSGIWRAIAPDHLALLSEGTIGACSVADGCGIPRINHYRQSSPDESCECGKTKEVTMTNIPCHGLASFADIKEPLNVLQNQSLLKGDDLIDNLFSNETPADMPMDAVNTLLRSALMDKYPEDLYTIHTFSSSQVVYELWSSMDRFSLGYTVDGDSKVVLSEETPTKVNIISRIVSAEDGSDINPEASEEAPPEEEKTTMSDTKTNTGASTEESTTEEVVVDAPEVNDAPAVQAKAPTVEEYLASAPAEIRESLTSGLKMHAAGKQKLVDEILANERNAFTAEQLADMNIEMLTNMAQLALTPSFEGAGGVVPNVNGGADDQMEVPVALEVFPLNPAA